jgi:predicted RNA binding protein YcfA (HicA-like mRNA interferase family)
MPRTLRRLINELKKAGFVDRGGKGSRRNFVDEKGNRVTLFGSEGDDAKPYQEKEVRENIERSQK